jgi:type II secretory pathway component PulK
MRSRVPHTAGPQAEPRRGIVIVGVLVVVTLLSLAAYQYADLMTAQHREAYTFTRAAQVRAFAESGIHYAAAALSTSDNITNVLGGSPFNNASAFQDQMVADGSDGGPRGLFSIVSPGDPDNQVTDGSGMLYGVIDENGKINVNTLMKLDPTGNTLYNVLMMLPNMTDDVANAIVDWIDPDDNPRANGAESDYYAGLQPPYKCKNGPLDSLEELLLVRGVTPQLLFGNDKNRNGMIDADEDNSDSSGAGWSAYLTVYSRESNVDPTGNPRVWVNDSSLTNLQTNLGSVSSNQDLVNFILLYRIYGGTTNLPKGITAQPAGSWSAGDLSTQKGSNQLKSLFDLTNSYVMVPGKNKEPATYYASPLLDPTQQESVLPDLFQKVSTSKSQYLWGRINVNTAPQAVLNALTALGKPASQSQGQTAMVTVTASGTSASQQQSGQSSSQPYLSADDIAQIQSNRPQIYAGSAPDPIYQTPVWLLTRAKLSVNKLKQIEQYVTTTSQVFRVQSVGYFEGGNQFARVEAVIDTNGGQPRLVTPIRDLSTLGKGFNLPTGNGR